MKKLLKTIKAKSLPLLAVVLALVLAFGASAFKSNHKTVPAAKFTSYYLPYDAGSSLYVPVTSATAPTTANCDGSSENICEGAFSPSDVTVTNNHDGTFTYTPKNQSPASIDYYNN